MKILMLGWELPPHNSGGLGVACYEMARHLAYDGVSIDFMLPYTAEHGIEEFTVEGATDISPEQALIYCGAYDSKAFGCEDDCPHEDSGLRGLQHRYTQYVERAVKHRRYDAIHAHDWLTLEAGMRAKQVTGAPLIAHVHATEFDRAGAHHGNPIVHDIEYNGLMMADRIIAVSEITRQIIIQQYGIPGDKIEVVHNAIDAEAYNVEVTEPLTYAYLDQMKAHGYKVVVSLGRLTVQKGLSQFLEAAAKAVSQDDKLLFLIAGSGEQRDELIEKAAVLGISDKVLFSGFVRGARWRDAYRAGDMFVMSSVSEPFGLTALEAAAYGNALILTKQSGVGEVLHNVLRYDFWDTDLLANQMLAVARHPSLQYELSHQVRKEFETFNWRSVSKKCKSIYAEHAPQPLGALA